MVVTPAELLELAKGLPATGCRRFEYQEAAGARVVLEFGPAPPPPRPAAPPPIPAQPPAKPIAAPDAPPADWDAFEAQVSATERELLRVDG